MKRWISMVFALLLGAFVLTSTVHAQPEPLLNAQQEFDQGYYEAALSRLTSLLEQERNAKYFASAMVLAGRCELQLGRSGRAIDYALSALHYYDGNESPWVSEAFFLLGTAHQTRGEYYEAAQSLVDCLDHQPGEGLLESATRHLMELVEGPVRYKAETLQLRARSEMTRVVLAKMLSRSATVPTIGVLVPEGSEKEDPGAELLKGIEIALERWKSANRPEVKLEIRKIPHDASRAVHQVRMLVEEVGVWALIIGGSEEEVIPATIEAQAHNVPVILPGQRRPTLNALGRTTVLPEADWRREGELAAMYAADSLHLKTYAILAPHTDRGLEAVEGFKDILADRDSVEILAQEWYFPEEGVSIARQMQRIRTIGFRREFMDSLRTSGAFDTLDSLVVAELTQIPDSLVSADSASADTLVLLPALPDSTTLDSIINAREIHLFEHYWRVHNDSIQRTVAYKEGKIDSNDIALEAFDAIFFPIESGSIRLFAPQLAAASFKTTRLGNSAWYVPDEVYRHRQYVEDLIVTTPYRLEAAEGLAGELRDSLSTTAPTRPTPWHIRGFDAATICLDALMSGCHGPGELGTVLSRTEDVELSSLMQSFENGVLSGRNMWKLTVKEGIVVPENTEERLLMLYPPVVEEPDSLDVLPELQDLLQDSLKVTIDSTKAEE